MLCICVSFIIFFLYLEVEKSNDNGKLTKSMVNRQRLSELAQPPRRRMSGRKSSLESSDTDAKYKSAEKNLVLQTQSPHKSQYQVSPTNSVVRRLTNSSSDLTTLTDTTLTSSNTDLSLGVKTPLRSTSTRVKKYVSEKDTVKNNLPTRGMKTRSQTRNRRSSSLGRETFKQQRSHSENYLSGIDRQSLQHNRCSLTTSDDENMTYTSSPQKIMPKRYLSTDSSDSACLPHENIYHPSRRENSSPTDGEISKEIARVSHDLAKDLEILSKSVDSIDTNTLSQGQVFSKNIRHSNFKRNTVVSDSLESSTPTISDSPYAKRSDDIFGNFNSVIQLDSLKYTNIQNFRENNAVQSESTPTYSQESTTENSTSLLPRFIASPTTSLPEESKMYQQHLTVNSMAATKPQRRTWIVGSEPLDNLMLSNAVSLSNKICHSINLLSEKFRSSHQSKYGDHSQLCKYEEFTEKRFSSNSSDVPLLQQTSTEEMAELVNNLRHIECVVKHMDSYINLDCSLQK